MILISIVVIMHFIYIGDGNHGIQGYSSNQNNVIQGQRLDMENRHTQHRT